MESFLEIIWNMFLVIFLVFVLNGFFVASEFAIVKVRATGLPNFKRKATWVRLPNKWLKWMPTCQPTQLGITLASLGLGWVGEPAIAHLIVAPALEALPFQVPSWLIFLPVLCHRLCHHHFSSHRTG